MMNNNYIKLIMLQIFLIFSIQLIIASETPEPASYLQPRHFNPHPYQNGRKAVPRYSTNLVPTNSPYDDVGPVQFPQDGVSLRKFGHPYAKLAQRKSQKPIIIEQENQRPVLDGLSTFAKRILNKSPSHRHVHDQSSQSQYPEQQYQYDDEVEQEISSPSKKHYAFSYTVRDHKSGDDFSHSQHQQNGAVHGSYQVQLPDGRTQIVKYTADDNGYRADVSYNLDQLPKDNHYAHSAAPTTPTHPSQLQNHHHHHDHHQHHIEVLQNPAVIETPPPIQHKSIISNARPVKTFIPNPAFVTAQPIYNYYKNLQLQGKPYSHSSYDDNVYQQTYEPVVSTTAGTILDASYAPQNYHEVDAGKLHIKEYVEPPPRNPQSLQQSLPHQHEHHHHHHSFPSTTAAPYFSGSKPALIAKIVPGAPSVTPTFEDISVLPQQFHHSATPATYTSTASYDDYNSPVKSGVIFRDYDSYRPYPSGVRNTKNHFVSNAPTNNDLYYKTK